MGHVYESVFLLPMPTKKQLGEDGWEFESSERLPRELVVTLESGLSLKRGKFYLGQEIYEGEGIKLIVVCDDDGEIENIFIQLRTRTIEEIRRVLVDVRFEKVEIFIP